MKIRKEIQIGLTLLIALICLYSGILYLKTSNFFYSDKVVYALYPNSEGLTPSTNVFAKGYNIGKIKFIDAADNMLTRFCFHISFNRNIKIPRNSYFRIKNQFIGGNDIILEIGDDTTRFFHFGDTIPMISSAAELRRDNDTTHPIEEISTHTTIKKINTVVDSFAVFLGNINYLITKAVKPNLNNILTNIAKISENLTYITTNLSSAGHSLQTSIKNIEKFTQFLTQNAQKINSILQNTQSFSAKLGSFDLKDIEKTVQNTAQTLQQAVQNIKQATNHINQNNGSLGLLINDKKLYENINASSYNLNLLLKDIKENPRRYIHIQVFGGNKDKKKKKTDTTHNKANSVIK